VTFGLWRIVSTFHSPQQTGPSSHLIGKLVSGGVKPG
jgi:hypothetical protein